MKVIDLWKFNCVVLRNLYARTKILALQKINIVSITDAQFDVHFEILYELLDSINDLQRDVFATIAKFPWQFPCNI